MDQVWISAQLARRLIDLPTGAEETVSLDLMNTTETIERTPEGSILRGVLIRDELLEQVASAKWALYLLDLSTIENVPLCTTFNDRFYKLVSTGAAPTIMISGIQMHRLDDPWADSVAKARAVVRQGAWVVDTCGGLLYTTKASLKMGAGLVITTEPDRAVRSLRALNPWSFIGQEQGIISLTISAQKLVAGVPEKTFDCVIHDPPRFSLAGELYGEAFYNSLRRILRRHGRLYHYTGVPYSKGRGRKFVTGVGRRLKSAGFLVHWDGPTQGFIGKAV